MVRCSAHRKAPRTNKVDWDITYARLVKIDTKQVAWNFTDCFSVEFGQRTKQRKGTWVPAKSWT